MLMENKMKKIVFITLFLSTILTSCDYEGEFRYKIINLSDYPLNIYVSDTSIRLNPTKTMSFYTNNRTSMTKKIDSEAYFMDGIDTLNISLNYNLKICYNYLLYENWNYNYEKSRIYNYTLIIDNTDICTKY